MIEDETLKTSIEEILRSTGSAASLSIAQVVDRVGLGIARVNRDMISHGEVRQIMFKLEREGKVQRESRVGVAKFTWIANEERESTEPMIRIGRPTGVGSSLVTTPEEISRRLYGDRHNWDRSRRRVARLIELEVELLPGGKRRGVEMARQVLGEFMRGLDQEQVEQLLYDLRSEWQER